METTTCDHVCECCTQGWKNFKNLSKKELRLVSQHRFETRFEPGEIIFKKDTPVTSAVFLIEGMAKVYLEGFGGKRLILAIVKPSRMLAGPGTYTDLKHHYTVVALTHTRACFIDIGVLKQLVHQNSRFAEGWIKDISHKALNSFHRTLGLAQKKMHGRLAEALIYLADAVFEADEFDLVLSRQELGELTNMTKESVVRILKEFSRDNLIEEHCPHIKLLQKDKLRKISDMG